MSRADEEDERFARPPYEPVPLPTFDITGAPNRPAKPIVSGPGYCRCSCCGAEFPEDQFCPYWETHI